MTENKIVDEKKGKITSINYDKRIVWVKDEAAVNYELKWRQKPEVIDDLMRKQKTGYRVKITVTKDLTEDIPQFWITNCVFDDSYKKGKSAYAQSPEEQKLILLQSCMRTGATVLSAMIGMQNVVAAKDEPIGTTFDAIMNKIRERAIADAAALLAEAKK